MRSFAVSDGARLVGLLTVAGPRQFKAITTAYEILSDEQKRSLYDPSKIATGLMLEAHFPPNAKLFVRTAYWLLQRCRLQSNPPSEICHCG